MLFRLLWSIKAAKYIRRKGRACSIALPVDTILTIKAFNNPLTPPTKQLYRTQTATFLTGHLTFPTREESMRRKNRFIPTRERQSDQEISKWLPLNRLLKFYTIPIAPTVTLIILQQLLLLWQTFISYSHLKMFNTQHPNFFYFCSVSTDRALMFCLERISPTYHSVSWCGDHVAAASQVQV